MTRLAAIDVGTNSTKMTIADVGDDGRVAVVFEDSDVTRLGEGVDQTKRLGDAPMARTLDAVVRFAEEARRQGAVRVLGAGTSALRDAANGAEFLDQAKQRAGVEIEIITGDREAQLAYAAVRSDASLALPHDASLLVFDIGGGSTELILGDGDGVGRHSSLDVGAVRLTERFLKSDPPSEAELSQASHAARNALGTFAVPEAAPVIVGIGGTAVNVASVTQGLTKRDADAVHGSSLTVADVASALDRFRHAALAERRQIPGLEPARADVITAGTLILELLLVHFHADRCVVSVRGLRYGLLADQATRR
jgi:exopolyphosphatase/guanosine-5'-triphosphate,3'-diphosphate pyrophosphatase